MTYNRPADPTPEDIAAVCEQIQRRWSEDEREQRRVSYADSRKHAKSNYQPTPYVVPTVRTADLLEALAG